MLLVDTLIAEIHALVAELWIRVCDVSVLYIAHMQFIYTIVTVMVVRARPCMLVNKGGTGDISGTCI